MHDLECGYRVQQTDGRNACGRNGDHRSVGSQAFKGAEHMFYRHSDHIICPMCSFKKIADKTAIDTRTVDEARLVVDLQAPGGRRRMADATVMYNRYIDEMVTQGRRRAGNMLEADYLALLECQNPHIAAGTDDVPGLQVIIIAATGRFTTVKTRCCLSSPHRQPGLVHARRGFTSSASRPSITSLLEQLEQLAKKSEPLPPASNWPGKTLSARVSPVLSVKPPSVAADQLKHPERFLLVAERQNKSKETIVEKRVPPRDETLAASSMSSSIEFITTPTADTPGTTIILRTQATNHYVFGSQAEGVQRALAQQGTRLTKVKDFFLTGKTEWSNVGGVAGMMLTMTDSSAASYTQSLAVWEKAKQRGNKAGDLAPPAKPHFNIYGPPNLKHMFGTCRRFIFRKGAPIHATEYTAKSSSESSDGAHMPSFQDDFLQVWALPVTPLRQETDPQADAELEDEVRSWEQNGNTFEEHQAPGNETPEERQIRHDRIRTLTVKHMFDSSWSFDTLVERHISEVEMPAAMFVRNAESTGYRPYTGPKPGGTEPLPDVKVWTRTPWPGAKIMSLPPTRPAPECISYIVRTYPARGSFDVKRAVELGVKKGPDFGKLSNGISVQGTNGDTITPEQVLGPSRPGQGFALLDVPSVDYLEAIVERDEFKSSDLMKGIEAFIWTLGAGVAGHPTLTDFMETCGNVKHIVSSADISPNRIAFDSVAGQTTRMAQVDPVRYQTPQYDLTSVPQKLLSEADHMQQNIALPANVIVADRGLSATLMPKFDLHLDTRQAPFEPETIMKETSAEVLELAKIAQETVRDSQKDFEPWRALLSRPDTEITTLGTGSALPSKYRNVSATLVRVPGAGNYLFDAGENTLGQLQRVFPPEELTQVLKDLRAIWISHLHADHHLGTASVIKAWYAIKHHSIPNSSPPDATTIASNKSTFGLSVISHDGMLQWLREYSAIEDYGYSRILPLEISPQLIGQSGSVLTINGTTAPGHHHIAKQDYPALFGFSDIQAVRVVHCNGSMACSVLFPRSPDDPKDVKPLKISYSGDCRPSHPFTKIGQDTSVLIHEATFDDELEGDARAKRHCTTSEALGVGAKMNAKAVVLTHFSQRYQKIPVLQTVQDGEAEEDKVASGEPDVDADDVEDPSGDTGNSDIRLPPGDLATTQPPNLVRRVTLERVVKVRNKDMKVAIAFDYMRVKLKDIVELEKYNDALNELLVKEQDGEDEVKEINTNGKRASEDEQGGKSKKQKKKEKGKSQRIN